MALSEARKRANAKYISKAYDDVKIYVKKGDRNTLKQYAERQETSLNNFVCSCISHCIENKVDIKNARPLGEVLSDIEGDK